MTVRRRLNPLDRPGDSSPSSAIPYHLCADDLPLTSPCSNALSVTAATPISSTTLLRRVLRDPAGLRESDLPALLNAGLGPVALTRLPETHTLRPRLAPVRLAMLARHLRIRAALETLLCAWHAAGITALLFKGFVLAEFVYPDPAQRFYGDVDVLIDPRQATRAAQVAQSLGWRDDGLSGVPAAWTHEVAHFYSPDGQTRLDVHRHVTAWSPLSRRKVERATRQVWSAACPARLGKAPVLTPDPRDHFLLIALTRAWSGDVAWLKPADPLDVLALTSCFGLPERVLLDRAAALGCRHTWQVFAQRCADLELEDGPARRTLRRARLLDGYDAPDSALSRLRRVPAALIHTLRALPDALAVRRLLATGGDPRQLPRRWTLATPRQPAVLAAPAALGGADRALKLLYPRPAYPVGATCVPRALTRYAALARAGVPVSFVSGVAQVAGGIVGHAWIELDPELDADYGEPEARGQYQVLFRHVAEAERSRLDTGEPA